MRDIFLILISFVIAIISATAIFFFIDFFQNASIESTDFELQRQAWLDENPELVTLIEIGNYVPIKSYISEPLCSEKHDIQTLGIYYYRCVPQDFSTTKLITTCNPFDSNDCKEMCISTTDVSIMYPLEYCKI